MSGKGKNILKYKHGENSVKGPFVISAVTESLLEKVGACYNDLENPSTVKVNKQTACSYLLFTQCSFDSNRNKYDYFRNKDCTKNLCKDLKENIMKKT